MEAAPSHLGRVNTPGIPLRKCLVALLKWYRTFRSVGYTGIEVTKLSTCRVPVSSSYRTLQIWDCNYYDVGDLPHYVGLDWVGKRIINTI